MRRFSFALSALLLCPALVSAQNVILPNLTTEIQSSGAVIQTPLIDANTNPLTPPPDVSSQVLPVPQYQMQQPVNGYYGNISPNQKPEYVPPVVAPIQVSPAGGYPYDVYLGYWQPGHYRQLTGSPYYYSAPNAGPRGPLAGNSSGYVQAGVNGFQTVQSVNGNYSYANPGVNEGYTTNEVVIQGGYSDGSNFIHHGQMMNQGYVNSGAMYGYSGNVNTGAAGGAGGDPYNYHFGPGYYRSGEYGHYRFPYYSYRRPWYYPGFAGYNRDTNLPW